MSPELALMIAVGALFIGILAGYRLGFAEGYWKAKRKHVRWIYGDDPKR